MTYPEWAPEELIQQIERNRAFHDKYPGWDPDEKVKEIVAEQKLRGNELSESAIENLQEQLNRKSFFLPPKEEEVLLEKIVTDLRMKNVWASLERRRKSDSDLIRFWRVCGSSIIGWRGEPKFTPKQRKKIFQEIFRHVAELQSLMLSTKEFDFYSINRLIEDSTIEWLIDVIDAKPKHGRQKAIEYTRFCLSEVVPSFHAVLIDVANKAKEFEKNEPIVLKPASENAHVHYFIRSLSAYVKDYYGTPLHEHVATTAAVMLDRQEIDSDFVRKLVNQ